LSHLPAIILPSVHELNLFKVTTIEYKGTNIHVLLLFLQSFLPVITNIQLLWELVLTCEPIVVMASTPDVACECVQALAATIWPLKFAADYRPFFTIHDSDFEKYTKKNHAP